MSAKALARIETKLSDGTVLSTDAFEYSDSESIMENHNKIREQYHPDTEVLEQTTTPL